METLKPRGLLDKAKVIRIEARSSDQGRRIKKAVEVISLSGPLGGNWQDYRLAGHT